MSSKQCGNNERRTRLGVGIAHLQFDKTRYYRTKVFSCLSDVNEKFIDDFCDGDQIPLSEKFLLQRNGKKALAMRTVLDVGVANGLNDRRREWNRSRSSETVLDKYFTSFKYSYSALLPTAMNDGVVSLMESSARSGRVADVARSHSIWLDAVDAPKELYKHRLRINRIVNWAYKMGLVPVMMTLTCFHRWHPLRELLKVMQRAWTEMFLGCSGKKRAQTINLRGWVRRLEVTINDGTDVTVTAPASTPTSTPASTSTSTINLVAARKFSVNPDNNKSGTPRARRAQKIQICTTIRDNDVVNVTNSGWHPHYHAILLVPWSSLPLLESLESEWQEVWINALRKQFIKFFGEDIDSSYYPALRRHGLKFSRHRSGLFEGQIRAVDNTEYLAKIIGCNSAGIFGGDVEMTAANGVKRSRTPFDLIRDSRLPAANVDLWVEYALATKGVKAFSYSQGLEKQVNAYFESRPGQDSTKYKVCPEEHVVATLNVDVYHFLYRNFKLDELRQKISEGAEALAQWLRDVFIELGVPELCDVIDTEILHPT